MYICMIDFVRVAWAWSTLSELLAYPNSSKFPLGQRGSDNRGCGIFLSIIKLLVQLDCLSRPDIKFQVDLSLVWCTTIELSIHCVY